MIILSACIFGILLGYWVPVFIYLIKSRIQVYKNNKQFKELQRQHQERRNKGELNQWVTIKFDDIDIQVDKNTGWCPSLEAFVSKTLIERSQKVEQEKKNYEAWLQEQYGVIAESFDVNAVFIEQIKKKLDELSTKYLEKRTTEMLKEKENVVQ